MSLPEPSHLAHSTLYSDWLKMARPQQLTPKGDWGLWLILAGRGWGKTMVGAFDTMIYALNNPESRCAVVTPTFGDLRRVAFEGVSGIMNWIPQECLLKGRGQGYSSSAAEIRLYNGSIIQGFAAIEPKRLRGPQFHRAWCDEVAAWQYPEAFDQLMFGLRLGDNPQCVVTTTPAPNKLTKSLIKRTNTVVTRGSTFDNSQNLSDTAIQQLKEKYEGTRMGRQELYGELLEDIEGALWSWSMIEEARVKPEQVPDLKRIVVAVDPAVTNTESSDETGIIVAGICANKNFYVLQDKSLRGSPDTWAREAVHAFQSNNADRLVAEVNNGGDLVERVIRTIDRQVPYTAVRASRGKIVRAEPIAALYEQGKVHHVGEFKELEDQLTTFSPDGKKSPDRLDALVWALTDLTQRTGQAIWRIS
jgi:predicted phage terminase large subunit-like protein